MTAQSSITRELAERCVSFNFEALPENVVVMAELALRDAIGCMYRGSIEPLTAILAQEFGVESWQPEQLLPDGLAELSAPANCAMVYAAAIHAIDYDDSHPALGHIGAPVIGAVLALARRGSYTNKQVLTAVVIGYEIAVRVSNLISPEHYARGFHTTGTLSSFGATAACAHLLGLDVDQMCQAFGMTTTQVAGVKSAAGTMAKPFNAAHAATSGVLSARLVAEGFSAPANAIEHPMGLMALYDGVPMDEVVIAPADEFFIVDNLFKLYASCHFTHPCIDGLGTFLAQEQVNPSDIQRIDLKLAPVALKTAYINTPTSGLECKFSFPQVTAMRLAGLNLADESLFTDQLLAREDVNQYRDRVETSMVEGQDPGIINYTFHLSDGSTREWYYNSYDHLMALSEQAEHTHRKFLSNVARAYGEAQAQALLSSFDCLAERDAQWSL